MENQPIEEKIEELLDIHKKIKPEVWKKLSAFRKLWEQGSDFEIFQELVFCLLTPASKARSAWKTLQCLLEKKLLLSGTPEEIAKLLNHVRFKNNKALNIVKTRELFFQNGKFTLRQILSNYPSNHKKREWLVKNVRGMGFKEASHFLRNTGFYNNMAVLDRHILRNLCRLGAMKEVPPSLSPVKYMEIERKMALLSKQSGIPLEDLDFVFWYRETKDIFK